MMRTPWEYLLSHYEFMIVFTSFQRNFVFYSSMDQGQLRNLYSQLVSFSPARILVIDTLTSLYKKKRLNFTDVPCELLKVIALALGNTVPRQLIHDCMSTQEWKGCDNMVLAAFASIETIRSGPLKYMAIIKESVRDRSCLRVIISLAITGWVMKLSDSRCTCGTWAQALELISCSVPDTETTLVIQDTARISAYIRTLLDLNPPTKEPFRGDQRPIDYGYVFRNLLVSGLDSSKNITTHH